MNWQAQNAEQPGYNTAFGNPPFQQGSNPAYACPPERRGSNHGMGYPAVGPGYGQQPQGQTANNESAHQQLQGQSLNHQFGQHYPLGRVPTSKVKPASLPGDKRALSFSELVEGTQGSSSASAESHAGDRGRNVTAARRIESKYRPPQSAEDSVYVDLKEMRRTVHPSALRLKGKDVERGSRSRASGFASRSRTTSRRDPSKVRVESLVEAEDESGDFEISASAFKEVR